MTFDLLTDLFKSIILLGAFLLLGSYLRARIGLFQKLFLTASVIGGFLLLILGPQVLDVFGRLGLGEDWFSYYRRIPAVLIVPIVAAVPLGQHVRVKNEDRQTDSLKNVFPLFFLMLAAAMIQFAIGYFVQLILRGSFDLYDVFGAELAIGFVGGHGTAGTLSNLLTEMNLDYASVSQGVAVTTASFGMVGGIVIGILMINLAARKGYAAMLSDPSQIPENMRIGYERDVEKQDSCGRETMMSSSVDTFTFHMSLILLACGGAYILTNYVKNIPILASLSVWAYAMLLMMVIWKILCLCKLDFLVDENVKSHITGPLTDFAVISAIASLPIKSVANYIIPILLMVIIGFAGTIAVFMLCSKLLQGNWFEPMIASFGMATGVFITGILLLHIVDPRGETSAMNLYSLSYTAMTLVYFATLGLLIGLPLSLGILPAFIVTSLLTIGCLMAAWLSSRICFKKSR